MENKNGNLINILVGVSVGMRIVLLGWQLHRLYRLEQAEKAMAVAKNQAEREPSV